MLSSELSNNPLRARDENALSQKAATQPAVVATGDVSPGATARVYTLPADCGAYVDEIIGHLLEREQRHPRNARYLEAQPDVTERMRVILIDWLVDVHLKFKLHAETFFLAVDYVDRYLMVAQGTRSTLQLVGVCAMLIAAKHEEIWPPEVRECVYISANTYTREDILNMEREIAAALNYRLCVPTPYPFMQRVLDSTEATDDARHLAAYCLDAASLDYNALQWLPSRVGYAAVLIANVVVENTRRLSNGLPSVAVPLEDCIEDVAAVWSPEHTYYSKLSTEQFGEIVQCARSILACANSINSPASRYHAVRRKYSSERFGQVATRYELPATM